ncbi:MAG TPA: hydantoinase B/oxoprolinase family protein [Solirubrobacterales bacterium]|nr:hydantoinase B/oxoprolinase family protein [Solirubrobacterales bacterium]
MSNGVGDVLAAEVHRKALHNVTQEMAIALVRTSGSPIVVEAMDFSTCVMDTQPEHLGMAAFVLGHFGTSIVGTQVIIDMLGDDEVRPGDGWIVNDPHEGGAAHQGDVAIIMPFFHGTEHLGWGFVNMHVLDVGGAGLSGIAPAAHDAYGEGLRFVPTRVIREGSIEPEWERFIAANVRAPGPVLNDIRSMIAANNVGNGKLNEVIDMFGMTRFKEYCEINKDLTEKVLRERIAALPDGAYESLEWDEWDGHDGPDLLLEMKLRMEIDGSDMRLAFTGAPQIDGFIQAGKGAMWGGAIGPLLTTLGYGDLPINGGIWRPLDIDLGEPGTVVNPTLPAPVSDGHAQVGMRAGKLLKDALSQALALSDDPVLRSRVGGKAHDGTPVSSLFGPNQHGTSSVILYLDSPVGIGGGAQSIGDGQDAYGATTMTGCGMSDLETHEAADPVNFLWRKVVPNSGGPGQYRGGQALDQAFAIAYVDTMGGPAWNSCAEVPPSGFGGGFPGSTSRFYIVRESNIKGLLAKGEAPTPERLEGTMEPQRNKVGFMKLDAEDVLVIVSGGGGGLGDPLLRELPSVVDDLHAGWITAEHALAAYGVVVDADGKLDADATAEAREGIRERRIGGAPERALALPARGAGVAVALDPAGSAWVCGSCDHALGSAASNWREAAVLAERRIEERFAELAMYVRARSEEPGVLMREHYCPRCAASLAVDVVTAGTPAVPAPELRSPVAAKA